MYRVPPATRRNPARPSPCAPGAADIRARVSRPARLPPFVRARTPALCFHVCYLSFANSALGTGEALGKCTCVCKVCFMQKQLQGSGRSRVPGDFPLLRPHSRVRLGGPTVVPARPGKGTRCRPSPEPRSAVARLHDPDHSGPRPAQAVSGSSRPLGAGLGAEGGRGGDLVRPSRVASYGPWRGPGQDTPQDSGLARGAITWPLLAALGLGRLDSNAPRLSLCPNSANPSPQPSAGVAKASPTPFQGGKEALGVWGARAH